MDSKIIPYLAFTGTILLLFFAGAVTESVKAFFIICIAIPSLAFGIYFARKLTKHKRIRDMGFPRSRV